MLIKEYRIPLPLTVEEYRIAQLYMIQVSGGIHWTGLTGGRKVKVLESLELVAVYT